MRIVVDYDKCGGLGMCEAVSPDVFEFREAVASCPTEALSLEED